MVGIISILSLFIGAPIITFGFILGMRKMKLREKEMQHEQNIQEIKLEQLRLENRKLDIYIEHNFSDIEK